MEKIPISKCASCRKYFSSTSIKSSGLSYRSCDICLNRKSYKKKKIIKEEPIEIIIEPKEILEPIVLKDIYIEKNILPFLPLQTKEINDEKLQSFLNAFLNKKNESSKYKR